jgi:hypothetical protein
MEPALGHKIVSMASDYQPRLLSRGINRAIEGDFLNKMETGQFGPDDLFKALLDGDKRFVKEYVLHRLPLFEETETETEESLLKMVWEIYTSKKLDMIYYLSSMVFQQYRETDILYDEFIINVMDFTNSDEDIEYILDVNGKYPENLGFTSNINVIRRIIGYGIASKIHISDKMFQLAADNDLLGYIIYYGYKEMTGNEDLIDRIRLLDQGTQIDIFIQLRNTLSENRQIMFITKTHLEPFHAKIIDWYVDMWKLFTKLGL